MKKYIILIISLFIVFFPGRNLLAADIFLNNLEGIFVKDEWIESGENIIIYFVNFHQLDRETAENFSLAGYFSDQFDTETGWAFSKDRETMELRGTLNRDSAFTIRNYQSLLDSSQDYFSWLAGSLNRRIEFGIEENYYGADKIKELEHGLQFEITLIPEKISYESQEIFTEIEFIHNSSSGINKIHTKTWLEGNSLKDIAVAARRRKTEKGETVDYYILQIAAFVVSAEEFTNISKGLLPIGNLSGLNELFNNEDKNNRENTKIITFRLSDKEVGLEFGGETQKYYYSLELKQLYSSSKMNFYAEGGLYLHNIEDIALSFVLDNENNCKVGFSDQVKWTENLRVGFSYYPLSIKNSSEKLAYLKLTYQGETWNAMYSAGFKGEKNMQEISVSYLPGQKGMLALSCGLDYNEERFISLSYSYSLF